MQSFQFTLESSTELSRAGSFITPHGTVQTPVFMPVGTQATVKALSPEDLVRCNAQIILGNTYHLALRPGEELIHKQGGIQDFMNWHKPVLTDSGGFQVFSLGKQLETREEKRGVLARESVKTFSKITDDGVEFSSHIDGTKHMFTPEKTVEIQHKIGADIIMAFDECTPDDADDRYAREALNRTHHWAARCKTRWEQYEKKSSHGNYQALFGIVQGAMKETLRKESASYISSLGFDGIAVGGETIGYNMQGTAEVMLWIEALLPKDKPRYAMGLGRDPQDIIDAVKMGFDMFDCVAPTRMARNGSLYAGAIEGNTPSTWKFVSKFEQGRLRIDNARWAEDAKPISETCDCWTCQSGFSRAYLRHLYNTKELLYYRLASIHNVRFMLAMTERLRKDIVACRSKTL